MSKRPIYLDYMATTPVDSQVIEAMLPYLGAEGVFGNAGSAHRYGQEAAVAVAQAREQIAGVVNANPEGIIFTSGATESDNLAILGATQFYARKGRHVITMQTEHKAVLDTCKQLEALGFEVTYLAPESDGLLAIESLKAAIRKDTILVSVMHVNNETGVIQDIEAIGECLAGRGIIFHVDAAQSIGRLKLDLAHLPVDLVSFSAHKCYGPKGVGGLYIRQKPRIRIAPQSFGGGQEGGLRSGTLPTHQIIGMGQAFEFSERLRLSEEARLLGLREQILEAIKPFNRIRVNGSLTARIAGNLNLCFSGMEQSELMMKLHEFAVSSTSACAASKGAGSHVLRAMGLSDADAQSSLRISFGRFTTDKEIQHLIDTMIHIVR